MNATRPAALVTAAAKRVGREMALKLAEMGFDIALHYRDSENEARAAAVLIENLGRKCFLLKADFAERQELESLLESALKAMPGLSVLVNNASVWQKSALLDSTLEHLQLNMKVHLEAPYILTRDFARLVGSGVIVNILDSNITRHKSDYFPYLLSKKALYELTMLAACELAPSIRVNAIAPGAVLPPEGEEEEYYRLKLDKNPLKRQGGPQDVNAALEFLVSNQHISGQCIYVSAGKHLF